MPYHATRRRVRSIRTRAIIPTVPRCGRDEAEIRQESSDESSREKTGLRVSECNTLLYVRITTRRASAVNGRAFSDRSAPLLCVGFGADSRMYTSQRGATQCNATLRATRIVSTAWLRIFRRIPGAIDSSPYLSLWPSCAWETASRLSLDCLWHSGQSACRLWSMVLPVVGFRVARLETRAYVRSAKLTAVFAYVCVGCSLLGSPVWQFRSALHI